MKRTKFSPRSLVFTDTSGWVAHTVRTDSNSTKAKQIMARLRMEGAALFTTNFVLAETHATLRYVGIDPALRFLQTLDETSSIIVVRVKVADEQAARAIIYRYTDKSFSLVDAMSFAVMRRFGLKYAFTFDAHFAQFGWQVLTA